MFKYAMMAALYSTTLWSMDSVTDDQESQEFESLAKGYEENRPSPSPRLLRAVNAENIKKFCAELGEYVHTKEEERGMHLLKSKPGA